MTEEAIWNQREEVIYPERFGSAVHGIFPLTRNLFVPVVKGQEIPAHWLQCGVFEFEPTAGRKSWVYVSSGTSNPGWSYAVAGRGYSGLGTELVLETKMQNKWAVKLLKRLLAHNILAASGHLHEEMALDYWHRRSLDQPMVAGEDSSLTHVVVVVPEHYESSFTLPSGAVDLLHVLGITENENLFAEQHGSDTLLQRLTDAGIYPLTEPKRECCIQQP